MALGWSQDTGRNVGQGDRVKEMKGNWAQIPNDQTQTLVYSVMHRKISWAMDLKVTKENVDSETREMRSGKTINETCEWCEEGIKSETYINM